MTAILTDKASAKSGRIARVPVAAAGERIVMEMGAGNALFFPFYPSASTMARNRADLVVFMNGGGKVVVKDFFPLRDEALPNLILPDGTTITAEDFFADSDFWLDAARDPAFAYRSGGNGFWSYVNDGGELVGGISRLPAIGFAQDGPAVSESGREAARRDVPDGVYAVGQTTVDTSDTIGSGFETAFDGRTGVVDFADGKLTVQPVVIRIIDGVAEIASTNASLAVAEGGMLGVASGESWGDASTLDAMEGLVFSCGKGSIASRMSVEYTTASWNVSVYFQLYDADGVLLGSPVLVKLPDLPPGTEGTFIILPPGGYDAFTSVMIYTDGLSHVQLSHVDVTVMGAAAEIAAMTETGNYLGLPANMAEPGRTDEKGGECVSRDGTPAAGAVGDDPADGHTDTPGWGKLISLDFGARDTVLDFSMQDGDKLFFNDLFGLNGLVNPETGFSLGGVLNAEDNSLTLNVGKSDGTDQRNVDVYFTGNLRLDFGSGAQTFPSVAEASAVMERDGIQEQAAVEILIRSIIC